MLISGLDTYFLEVSAHALLKVATETSFSGEKIRKFSIFRLFFQNQKRRSMTFAFFIILERFYLGSQCTSFLYTIFSWLLVAQNKKLESST